MASSRRGEDRASAQFWSRALKPPSGNKSQLVTSGTDCPLFVRVLFTTGPNKRLGHVQDEPGSIGVNWEGLTPLPPLVGLENHCTRKGTGGSNPSPSAKSLGFIPKRWVTDHSVGMRSRRRPTGVQCLVQKIDDARALSTSNEVGAIEACALDTDHPEGVSPLTV